MSRCRPGLEAGWRTSEIPAAKFRRFSQESQRDKEGLSRHRGLYQEIARPLCRTLVLRVVLAGSILAQPSALRTGKGRPVNSAAQLIDVSAGAPAAADQLKS
jgi:hypothetical protein